MTAASEGFRRVLMSVAPLLTSLPSHGHAVSEDWAMLRVIWMGIGVSFAVVAGIWVLIRRGRAGEARDLGTVSEQWVTDQRANDREWGSCWGPVRPR
jgi:hypothetical protein